MAPVEHDPLLLLRSSIASGCVCVPTTSADADGTEAASLSQATHLQFTNPTRVSIAIDTRTRFESTGQPVDLRSIYFAWLNREVAIPEYNASATKLNEELAGVATVHKFAFVERLDLITWLEGASEESEFIKPIAGEKDADRAASAAMPATASVSVTTSARASKGTLDPRLAEIYNGERRMGDRNTILRGIKPTDFSHVRKLAAPFMAKKPGMSAAHVANNPSPALNPKPQRRPDPIILLSPSASSLLRMSNVKALLEGGRYVPPDSNSGAQAPSMLHVARPLRDIDPSGRPMRFILVEGPEQFKPEYWNRVVAVFTTGQAWQFKNYRWSDPHELFKHVPGIFLGWRGDQLPETVRAYGGRVLHFTIEKWRDPKAPGGDAGRWRDRETVESIWKAIESNMRTKGWGKDVAPTSI